MDFLTAPAGPTTAQIAHYARHIASLSDEVAASVYEQLVIVYPGDPIVDQASVLRMIKNSSDGRTKVNKFIVEAQHSLCPLTNVSPAPARADLGPESLPSSQASLDKTNLAQKNHKYQQLLERTGYPETAAWKAQRAAAHGLYVSEYDFDNDYPWQTYFDSHGKLNLSPWALSWYDKYQAVLAGESAFIRQMYLSSNDRSRIQMVDTVGVTEKLGRGSERGWHPASILDVAEDEDEDDSQLAFLSSEEYLEWHGPSI